MYYHALRQPYQFCPFPTTVMSLLFSMAFSARDTVTMTRKQLDTIAMALGAKPGCSVEEVVNMAQWVQQKNARSGMFTELNLQILKASATTTAKLSGVLENTADTRGLTKQEFNTMTEVIDLLSNANVALAKKRGTHTLATTLENLADFANSVSGENAESFRSTIKGIVKDITALYADYSKKVGVKQGIDTKIDEDDGGNWHDHAWWDDFADMLTFRKEGTALQEMEQVYRSGYVEGDYEFPSPESAVDYTAFEELTPEARLVVESSSNMRLANLAKHIRDADDAKTMGKITDGVMKVVSNPRFYQLSATLALVHAIKLMTEPEPPRPLYADLRSPNAVSGNETRALQTQPSVFGALSPDVGDYVIETLASLTSTSGFSDLNDGDRISAIVGHLHTKLRNARGDLTTKLTKPMLELKRAIDAEATTAEEFSTHVLRATEGNMADKGTAAFALLNALRDRYGSGSDMNTYVTGDTILGDLQSFSFPLVIVGEDAIYSMVPKSDV